MHDRQPNTAPAVAMDTSHPFVFAYCASVSWSTPKRFLNVFCVTMDAMLPFKCQLISHKYVSRIDANNLYPRTMHVMKLGSLGA